ncbi:MAG TPA: hypothetical protein VMU02_04485 [bacterium]|nr:hypothetical protein [bacterium]
MTTLAEKSTEITNFLSTPKKLADAYYSGAVLREKVATVEKASGDGDGSIFGFFLLPSDARLSSLQIANDALSGCTSVTIGLHTMDDAGNLTAVSAALFASALDIHSAQAFTNITYQATATNIDKVEKRLWELAGLSADPIKNYLVTLTATTAGSAAGTISMKATYTI